jgi:hypothetical protein
MNYENTTGEEIHVRHHSYVKMIVKDSFEHELSNVNIRAKNLQRKETKKEIIYKIKKRVRFKDSIQDVAFIESFKIYNKKMCYDDFGEDMVETKRSCCSKCSIF